MGKFDGKVAIVTGRARGMGAATVQLFAAEGAKVVIADVLEAGEALAEEIGSNAMFYRHDVGDEDSWKNLDRELRDRFGPAQILVNNAGVLCVGEIISLELKDFERTLRVNLLGTFLSINTIVPGMIEIGGGSNYKYFIDRRATGDQRTWCLFSQQMGYPRIDESRSDGTFPSRHPITINQPCNK